jgi:hypothetical protein
MGGQEMNFNGGEGYRRGTGGILKCFVFGSTGGRDFNEGF